MCLVTNNKLNARLDGGHYFSNRYTSRYTSQKDTYCIDLMYTNSIISARYK